MADLVTGSGKLAEREQWNGQESSDAWRKDAANEWAFH